jgi:hypothetical protein
MLVEYVGENFRLPSQVDGPIADNGKTKLGGGTQMKGEKHIPLPGEFACRV